MSTSQIPKRPGKSREAVPEPSLEEEGASALDWVTRYAVPLFGVVGAALYGVLRLAYLFFYMRLRASPDEVGYGYSQVLADELIGAIELVVLVAALLALIGTAAMFAIRLIALVNRRGRARPATRSDDRTPGTRKLLLWCLAISIPVVLIGLPVIGWLEGEESAKGYTVRNVYLTHFVALPVLAVEAVPAKVSWVAASGSEEANISARQCLLYLGQANNITVFYDVHSKESVRLPSADIVVTLQDTISVPIGC